VLYASAGVTYSSILIKVFVMMEHALKTGARWLLKTDDDAYVNVPQTVQVRDPMLCCWHIS
jgi:Fringe-like